MAGSRRHSYDQDGFCTRCGADREDAKLYKIGCEAATSGNEPGYRGFALTPAEQQAGVTIAEKASRAAQSRG